MTNAMQLPRRLLILGIILPMAALLGYFIATPDQINSVVIVGLIAGTLLTPVLLKWHHPMLILAINASISISILPGQPSLWILLAGISFGISVLERGLVKKKAFTYMPAIVWPLLILAAITYLTAKLTGGLGMRAVGGSSYGGKRYFFIFVAILAYFALTSQRVKIEKATKLVALFFASSLTAFMSNIIYLLGPAFYFLYAIFPVDLVWQQVIGEYAVTNGIVRFSGFALGGSALIYILLAKYGFKGLFSVAHPWRFAAFVGCLFLTLLGGFRSSLLMVFMLCAIQFFMEGLHRTRLILFLGLAAILVSCAVLPFANRLPLSIQRSLSFLPIDVDPAARLNAIDSTEWRLKMWAIAWPQVPRYLLLGKGCALDPTELYLLHQSVLHGYYGDIEESLFTGSYHSGPLTLLIQFGGFAAVAFLWFAFASLRMLYRYARYGPEKLRLVNSFLFSYFLMRFVYFIFFYGHFAEDLYVFTGTIGLAVSINGNLKEPLQSEPKEELASDEGLGTNRLPQPTGAV